MSEHGIVIKKRFRSYFMKVLLWIPVAGLAGAFLLALAVRAFAGMPSVVGALGMGVAVTVVLGALFIHRKNVRCPACDTWVYPVGFNGFVPSRCQKCSADFR